MNESIAVDRMVGDPEAVNTEMSPADKETLEANIQQLAEYLYRLGENFEGLRVDPASALPKIADVVREVAKTNPLGDAHNPTEFFPWSYGIRYNRRNTASAVSSRGGVYLLETNDGSGYLTVGPLEPEMGDPIKIPWNDVVRLSFSSRGASGIDYSELLRSDSLDGGGIILGIRRIHPDDNTADTVAYSTINDMMALDDQVFQVEVQRAPAFDTGDISRIQPPSAEDYDIRLLIPDLEKYTKLGNLASLTQRRADHYWRLIGPDLADLLMKTDPEDNMPWPPEAVREANEATPGANFRGDIVTLYRANFQSNRAWDSIKEEWVVFTPWIGGTLIADNGIITSHLAAEIITSDKIKVGAVNAAHIISRAISNFHLRSGAVDERAIANRAVVAGKLAPGSVAAINILTDAIIARHILSDAIETRHVAAGAITAQKIGVGQVMADQIAANAVIASKIAADAVIASKIAANQITGDHIKARESLRVGDGLYAGLDGNLIARGSITGDEIAGRTITGDHIQANTIDANEMKAGFIRAEHFQTKTATFDGINADVIIQNGTVTGDHLAFNTLTANEALIENVISNVRNVDVLWQNDNGVEVDIFAVTSFGLSKDIREYTQIQGICAPSSAGWNFRPWVMPVNAIRVGDSNTWTTNRNSVRVPNDPRNGTTGNRASVAGGGASGAPPDSSWWFWRSSNGRTLYMRADATGQNAYFYDIIGVRDPGTTPGRTTRDPTDPTDPTDPDPYVPDVPPEVVVDAGPDVTLESGDTHRLTGTPTFVRNPIPAENNPPTLVVWWREDDNLDNTRVEQPTFTAPTVSEETDYTLVKLARYGSYDLETDTVIITVLPEGSTIISIDARAGQPVTVVSGGTVQVGLTHGLTGANRNASVIRWRVTRSGGVGGTFDDATIDRPRFTAGTTSSTVTVTLEKRVTNGGEVDTDTVTVTIRPTISVTPDPGGTTPDPDPPAGSIKAPDEISGNPRTSSLSAFSGKMLLSIAVRYNRSPGIVPTIVDFEFQGSVKTDTTARFSSEFNQYNFITPSSFVFDAVYNTQVTYRVRGRTSSLVGPWISRTVRTPSR